MKISGWHACRAMSELPSRLLVQAQDYQDINTNIGSIQIGPLSCGSHYSHHLPIEQGYWHKIPKILRWCACAHHESMPRIILMLHAMRASPCSSVHIWMSLGRISQIFQDAHEPMQDLMWHHDLIKCSGPWPSLVDVVNSLLLIGLHMCWLHGRTCSL